VKVKIEDDRNGRPSRRQQSSGVVLSRVATVLTAKVAGVDKRVRYGEAVSSSVETQVILRMLLKPKGDVRDERKREVGGRVVVYEQDEEEDDDAAKLLGQRQSRTQNSVICRGMLTR
jgi:hypothetical protein